MTVALAMRLELKRLMQKHQHQQQPSYVPLEDPTPHAQVLTGYASTTSVDGDRAKFRAYAFTWLPWKLPPLLHKHGETAGTIEKLDYDERGNLRIRATVTHPEARRCNAFSVGARVATYTMHNMDRPDFYACVTSAELTEVSLTDAPSNASALVQHRHPAPPASTANAFYDLMTAKVQCLQRLVPLLAKEEEPSPVVAPERGHPSSFRSLIEQINANHAGA